MSAPVDATATLYKLIDAMLLIDEVRDLMHEGLTEAGVNPFYIQKNLGLLDKMVNDIDSLVGLTDSCLKA